jgi:hypothetical protein
MYAYHMKKRKSGLAKKIANYNSNNNSPPSNICGCFMGELIKQESQGSYILGLLVGICKVLENFDNFSLSFFVWY